MLDAKKKIVVFPPFGLIYETAELFLSILGLSRIFQIVLLHPHWIENNLILP